MSTTLAHISFENWSPHARFASQVAERLACKLRQEQLFTNVPFPLTVRDELFVDQSRLVDVHNKNGNIVVIEEEQKEQDGELDEQRRRKVLSDYLDWARWSMRFGQSVLTGDLTIRSRAAAAISADDTTTTTTPVFTPTKGITTTATGALSNLLDTATATPREATIGLAPSSLPLSPSLAPFSSSFSSSSFSSWQSRQQQDTGTVTTSAVRSRFAIGATC